MPEDPDYKSVVCITPEKIAASVLVVIWVIAAYQISGLRLGVRTGIFFMFPLAFVWIPEVMEQRTRAGASATRVVGWLMILGVPAVWLAFSSALK